MIRSITPMCSLILFILVSFKTSASTIAPNEIAFQRPCPLPLLQIYDPILGCTNCPIGSEPSVDLGIETCVCKVGFIKTFSSSRTTTGNPTKCIKCESQNKLNMTSTPDRMFCVECNTLLPKCSCSANHFISVRLTIPTSAPNKSVAGVCQNCPSGHYPSKDHFSCIPCGPNPNMFVAVVSTGSPTGYTCNCRTDLGFMTGMQGGACLSSGEGVTVVAFLKDGGEVKYENILNRNNEILSATVRSDTFNSMFGLAVSKCDSEWDFQACQVLANLCVLQLYDETTDACAAYIALAKGRQVATFAYPDMPQGMPWLYYGLTSQESAVMSLSKSPNVTVDVSSKEDTSKLQFVLASYSLNGTFLGIRNLTSELQFCDDSNDMSGWLNVGHNYNITCSVNIHSLATNPLPTIFYDLYLLEDSKKLFPVPIRLLDFQTNSDLVNINVPALTTRPIGAGTDTNVLFQEFTDNRLTRRFTLVDTDAGVQDGSLLVVRFASMVKIRITKVIGKDGMIYSPVVDIKYSERSTIDLDAEDRTEVSSPELSFSVVYKMDQTSFWDAVQIAFSVMCIFTLFAAFFKSKQYSNTNLQQFDSLGSKFFYQLMINLFGQIGRWFYILLFSVTMFILFFYKGQAILFILVPNSSFDEYNFKCVFIAGFICQIVYVAFKLHKQCIVDLFFIDWEKPKGKVYHHGIIEKQDSNDSLNNETNDANGLSEQNAPISVWRSILVTNQWQSLQTFRRINIPFTLAIMYTLLYGLDLRYVGTERPDITDIRKGHTSPLLLFAINSMIWWILCTAQWVVRYLVVDRFYRHKIFQYVDLLSVSNVSLLVLDEVNHGYYVHGRSCHGYADTDMKDLNDNLKKEESDIVPNRGLNDSNQQGFEVFLSHNFRATFNKIYYLIVNQSMNTFTKLRLDRLTKQGKQKKSASVGAVEAHDGMNRLLCSFFDKNLKEFQYKVREKTYTERFLGVMTTDIVQDVSTNLGSTLYNDELSFANVLLYGLEKELLLLYIFLYNFIDIYTGNFSLAMIITFLCDQFIVAIRAYYGEKNISRKTLLDKKFLL